MVNFLCTKKKHIASQKRVLRKFRNTIDCDSRAENDTGKTQDSGAPVEAPAQASRSNPFTSDIDDIFSNAASKKKAISEKKAMEKANNNAPGAKVSSDPSVNAAHKHGVIASAYGTIISPDPPVHRIDKESGLKVYKYAGLKVGEGGGTPLCPFDCDCCF